MIILRLTLHKIPLCTTIYLEDSTIEILFHQVFFYTVVLYHISTMESKLQPSLAKPNHCYISQQKRRCEIGSYLIVMTLPTNGWLCGRRSNVAAVEVAADFVAP